MSAAHDWSTPLLPMTNMPLLKGILLVTWASQHGMWFQGPQSSTHRHCQGEPLTPAHYPSTASQYSSKLARLLPPSASPNSHDKVLQTRTITASKCISKLTRLRPPIASPISSIMASKLAQSRRPSVSPTSLDYGLEFRMIMASKCIYRLAWSRPPSASRNSLNHSVRVYLWVHPIIIFRLTSNCSQAPPAASPNIPFVDG